MQNRTINENNPYHSTAGDYERKLSLPIVSAIRRQESATINSLIERYVGPDCRALEIGPGTGFYTRALAQACREVVAVEDATEMADILREKLAAHSNVTVLNNDFRALPTDDKFEVVMAIGVLDYISEPAAFVDKMCGLATKAVIFTTPHRSFWGWVFSTGSKLHKINVYCRGCDTVAEWVPSGWQCATALEVGLKTPLTRGMTLIVALEPQ